MRKLWGLVALSLLLSLAGCASLPEGTAGSSASQREYTNPNWGTDATCAPGCPVGQGGGW